ncbi:hypothetical protein JHK82_022259 [Glycine max]|nr:hypothetical protein JHK82_022259 [Glycine max]
MKRLKTAQESGVVVEPNATRKDSEEESANSLKNQERVMGSMSNSNGSKTLSQLDKIND